MVSIKRPGLDIWKIETLEYTQVGMVEVPKDQENCKKFTKDHLVVEHPPKKEKNEKRKNTQDYKVLKKTEKFFSPIVCIMDRKFCSFTIPDDNT